MSGMHAFDTLAFAKKLKSAGYSEAQAEALAEAQGEVFREMLESTLASKDDIDGTRAALAHRIDDVEQHLGHRIDDVEQRLGHRIDEMGSKMTIRLGGMLVVGVGVLAAMKFFG